MQTQNRLTLTQVAKELDVAVSTVWRWTLHGVRGRRLRSRMIGGRRWVDRRSLTRFLEAGTEEETDTMSPDRAADILDADDI